jgi:DNA-binding CsgD family transcriptional regulator
MISYSTLASHKACQPKLGIVEILDTSSAMADELAIEDSSFTISMMAAISDPSKWNAICTAIAELAGGDLCTLTSMTESMSRARYASQRPADVELPGATVIAYHAARRGKTFVVEHTRSTDDVFASPASGSACGHVLDFGQEGPWLLRVARRQGRPAFSETEVSRLNATLPHLTTASWTSAHVQREALRQLKAVHEHLGVPFAVLDSAGRVLTYNASFEKTAAHYFANALHMPLPLGHADAATFKMALRVLSETDSERELPLRDTAAPCVAALRVLPHAEARLSQSKLFGLTLRGLSDMRVPNTTMLSNLYGLTHREADVAALLASGTSVNTIARKHVVSVSTIRVQLKSIFRKLSVRSQIEMVAKLHASGV